MLRSLSWLRYFQSSLHLLVERGHNVRLLLEEGGHGPVEQSWLEQMLMWPNFACDIPDRFRRDVWHKRGVVLRAAMEYVHCLGPAYKDRPRYLRKALRRSPPPVVRRLAELPLLRTPLGLRVLYRLLGAIERALPVPARVDEYIERLLPDVVALGDYGSRSSLHTPFLRAAKRHGIPVATCVASWDNLTTRPPMRVAPHRLVVWNETQLQEAVELHRIPAERVVITGAFNFDHWFDWKPRPRTEFLTRVGLDPARPVILWVGAALNNWELPETGFVSRWLAALRASSDPLLREAGVLLRPHPLRLQHWLEADFSEYGNVTVWPRKRMTMPIDLEQKADYYDSIFHSSAVVGINTSAMIEAAIVGRPVLTVLEPDHHDSQLGAIHFLYLLESGGGALRLAQTLQEHFADLSAALAGRAIQTPGAAERFLAEFVRPHGLDRPATPIFIETLEELAAVPVTAEPDPFWVAALRKLIVLAMCPITPARVKAIRRLSKRSRRLAKKSRRFLFKRTRSLSKRVRRSLKRRRGLFVVLRPLRVKRIRRLAKRGRVLLIILPPAIRIRLRRLQRGDRLPAGGA